MHKMT